MKIRKFTAPDMSRALRMVREELGADAVILSNRKDGRLIELIAAADYDPVLFEASRKEVEELVGAPIPPPAEVTRQRKAEREQAGPASPPAASLPEPAPEPPSEPRPRVVEVHAGQEAGAAAQLHERAAQEKYSEIQRELHAMRALLDQQLREWGRERLRLREPARARWVEQMMQAGFDEALARAVSRQVHASKSAEAGWHDVLVRLSQQLPVVQMDLQIGQCMAFFGLAGSGKTTTLIKLASRFVIQQGASRLRLVSLDQQRLGARAQMEALAAILGVPLEVGNTEAVIQPDETRLTLVDTPAMPVREAELQDYLQWLAFRPGWQYCQVLPATADTALLHRQLELGQQLEPACLVLTQLDLAPRLGHALSVLMQHSLPLAWVGDGPQIPEDLQRARAARLVVRAMESLSSRSVHPPAKSLYTGTGSA